MPHTHDTKSVYLVNDELCGIPDSLWQVTCRCGFTATHVLLSKAQHAHDEHAGTVVSHVHTAEMLEG
jgi:hypothetical protein